MFDRDRWREVFDTLKSNKLRTALSGFTIFIGIYIFTALTGMGNGLRKAFVKRFKNTAPNAIFISPGFTTLPYGGFKSNREVQFTDADIDYIRERFPDQVQYISAQVSRNLPLRYWNQYGTYSVRGVDSGEQFIEQIENDRGRYIDGGDVKAKRKVAVIGHQLAIDLFRHEQPIGKYLYIEDTPFEVVGIFRKKGGNTNEELRCYVPRSTLQFLYGMGEDIDLISLNYNPKMDYRQAIAFGHTLGRGLKKRHFISARDHSALFVHNMVERQKNANAFLGVIMVIVALISVGTLIAGAISISNIMVFVVKERTREIGIRKALGARPASIIALILHESLLITAVSGYLGLMAGVLTLQGLDGHLEDYSIIDPHVNSSVVIAATTLLILSGILAGYAPARRAARIKPIAALNDA